MRTGHVTVSWTRLVGTGVLLAGAVLAAGLALERYRFGSDSAATVARLEREVEGTLAAQEKRLRAFAAAVSREPAVVEVLSERTPSTPALFEWLERRFGRRLDPEESVTIYGADGGVLAWNGRGSTLLPDRVGGAEAWFVAPGPLGLRLVSLAPVVAPGPEPRRVGAVAAERVLSSDQVVSQGTTDYTFPTSVAPVALVPRFARSAPTGSLKGVVLRGAAGEPLLEITADPKDLEQARQQWRQRTRSLAALVLAAALLLLGAPIAEWRRRGSGRRFLVGTASLVGLLVLVRTLAWLAIRPDFPLTPLLWASDRTSGWTGVLWRSPADFLFNALLAVGIVAVVATMMLRIRLAWRTRRGDPRASGLGLAALVVLQVIAGTIAGGLLVVFELALRTFAEHASIDILHLTLHPYDIPRLELLGGVVLFHAAALWAAAFVLIAGRVPFRLPPGAVWVRAVLVTCWMAGAVAVLLIVESRGGGLPAGPYLLSMGAVALMAVVWRWGAPWFRRGSQGRRLVIVVLALVVPSLLVYPSLFDVADRAKHRLIADRFAAEALTHPQTLLARLNEAIGQVNKIPRLPDLLATTPVTPRIDTESAFAVWRQTSLATSRLTSAVEMYDAQGRLVSRFALNLPEYQPRAQRYRASGCAWEVFGEAAPFGAEERRMLHAERGICDRGGAIVGALVLHVMLDYSTLSFISSQNPYAEIFRGHAPTAREDWPGRDVVLVIYGWGRTPVYSTAGRAWPLDDALFSRLYRSTQGFWSERVAGGTRYNVYFVDDRNGIYALGYPAATPFRHGVRLAELATLGTLLALLGVLIASLFQRLAWREGWTGRQLLAEIRTSFSRKLFLAFVAATVIPVLILAVVIRAYVAGRLRSDVEAEAARTVSVAQRVVEETLTLDRRGEISAAALDDDSVVWISRVVNQDVNVYAGPQLVATSVRDLFASGQLPTRIPDAAYRAIVINRLPSFVGEDEIAGHRYLMAAAPVRTADPEAVLTVPFTLRQREIEREIDELDRGVQLGAVVFILFGAAIGYWMAQRISDPVERLTRASQRIAAGHLDTRVFVRSADELRRLVDAFNKMAWELQRQRAQLERTNRLEAWAEMARQVAHDIKNPLTPIQLSAEHLRRVHHDRGEPLSPVLEGCVDTILAQVRLLRQIAAEFSSFASTPVLRPVWTEIPALLHEAVDPYEVGLAGRVAIEFQMDDDLPQVCVDRGLVGRAIVNVVENALHAMPAGGSLTLRSERAGDGIGITVRDTGVGMDEEALGRIFEPYFSTKATGTGLGLTIAKRNVELHGGRISISSQRGTGTTVTLLLPIEPVEAVAAALAVTGNQG